MATKIRMTEARVRDALVGEYADEAEQGLMLYVSPTAKTWGLYRWSPTEKRPIRKSIGRWPLVTVDEARKRAKALSLKLLDGESLARPDTLTLGELTERYVRWNRTRDLKYPDWIDGVIRLSFGEWWNRDVSTITRADLAERHLLIAEKRGRVAAARSVKAMRTLYKFADENELYTGRNVAKAVRLEDTQPRRRFLSTDEQARVRAAVDDPSLAEWVKPLMLLALTTAARRANLCAMRWDALDLDAGIYRVKAAESKNKIPMDIVLPPEAVAILRKRQKSATSEWVFPSPKATSGHIVETWYAIKRVYEIAKVEDATLHDARRTLGTRCSRRPVRLSLPFSGRSITRTQTPLRAPTASAPTRACASSWRSCPHPRRAPNE